MATSSDLVFDWLSSDDVLDAVKIEKESYPPDEAGSLESFQYRQAKAGNLFLGAYLTDGASRELIGYVCSTLSPTKSLTHESMSTHVPNSSSVCIHSVCVSSGSRRKGIGLNLLREYISRLEAALQSGAASYDRVLLITHEELRPFYEKAGFEWLGKSDVVHGSKPWFEMAKSLTINDSGIPREDIPALPPAQLVGSQSQQMPAGIWEALQRPSRNRPISRPLSSFPNGLGDIISTDEQGSSNKFDLLCPRPGCGSIILKRNVAKWVERSSVEMEPEDYAGNPHLPTLPAAPETTQWWLVTPSPMEFENIGFSRSVKPKTASEPKLKLLICAECDLGPLGWSEEGGSEFWLACSRVGYRE